MIFQPERYLLKKQIKEFAPFIKGRVLDVGAGGTKRYKNLFEFSEYITLDLNPEFNPDFIGSAESLPFEDGEFDSIVCTQVLEHIGNPEKAVANFFRVLKKDGICLITVPQLNELHGEPYDFWRYTKFGLSKLLESQGFKIIKIDQRGGFFSSIAQLRIRYFIDAFNLMRGNFNWFWSPITNIYGRFMIWLDSLDKQPANKKHAIGWLVVAKKV